MTNHDTTDSSGLPKIIAVDFDGTLCENEFPEIGEPKSDIIREIQKLKENGWKVILWTCRNREYLEEALDWCKDHDVPIDCVNENLPEVEKEFGGYTRKIYADIYLDDKGTSNVLGIWRKAYA